jgi:CubicO group peptidase (beta-lactamase class C family)
MWSYSREAYVYLQQAVEHLTGEPLESFAERTIFRPFAMPNSSFVWRSGFASNMASGYTRDGTASNSMPYTRAVASTTLYTTVEDYAHFLIGMLAVTPRDRMHESAVSLMLNPAVVVDSASRFSWGLGWGIESSGGDTYFVHWGENPGYQCLAIASRKTGRGLVIFTNSENGFEAAREILPDMLGSAQPFFKLPRLQPME